MVVMDEVAGDVVIGESAPGVVVVGVVVAGVVVAGVVVVGVVVVGAEPGALGAALGMRWMGRGGGAHGRCGGRARGRRCCARDGGGGGRHEIGHGVTAVESRALVPAAKIASGGEQVLDERVRRRDRRALGCLVGPAGVS